MSIPLFSKGGSIWKRPFYPLSSTRRATRLVPPNEVALQLSQNKDLHDIQKIAWRSKKHQIFLLLL
jgi:hypothetical protein